MPKRSARKPRTAARRSSRSKDCPPPKRGFVSEVPDRIRRLINSSLEMDEVLNLSMQLMEKTLGASTSSILLHDAGTNELKFYLATGDKKDILKVIRIPADQGVAGRSFTTGKTLLIPDASKSPFFYKKVDEKSKFVTKNLIATPIEVQGKRIGIIEVLNKARGTFSAADSRTLQSISKEISIAIENARLYDEVKRAYIESMLNMAKAEKYRDNDTGMHIERCGEFAYRLGPALGFAPKDLDNLRTSMMMHDIGKIATPDAVLLKPAKLDPMEWEIMKRHTTQGGEILGRGPHLKVAVEIATCHHEKWDGSGYPQGLSGAGIPVAARLAAIIDVFDALSSKRPYKDPMPPEQVVSILKEGSGKHFDPQMVALFLSRIEEMREVYKSMS
jgi:response regulator RpfG family c-di-GMP phosphodiesterase